LEPQLALPGGRRPEDFLSPPHEKTNGNPARTLFYKTGATNKVRHYDNEKPIGRWLHFYEDGKLWEERFFSAPGVPDGEEVLWNTNGVVSFRHTWRKGEPWDGRFTLHKGTNWFRDQYESGTLVSSTNLGPFPPWAYVPALRAASQSSAQ